MMQMGKSMTAEMMPLGVNSLSVHQIRSLRIDLTRLVPPSALPVFINFMTTGVLNILAECGVGGKALD